MKLCAVSDSLGNLSFKEAARVSADLGLAALEIGMGNWSVAPHANLQSLLESKRNRQEFLSVSSRMVCRWQHLTAAVISFIPSMENVKARSFTIRYGSPNYLAFRQLC